MRRLPPMLPVAVLALVVLTGCSAEPDAEPTTGRATPSAAVPTATAAPLMAPEGSVLAGTAVLTDADGARLTLLMVAEEPVDGDSGAADDAIARLVADCPGEYDADVFDTLPAQIMRVDIEVVASKGTWDPSAAIALRPTATDSPSLGLTADGVITATGDGATPRCRRAPTLTGAGSGHVYLVLAGTDAPLSWRTLRFGAAPASGSAPVEFSDCRFALRSGLAGTVAVDTADGCVASVTP